MKIEKGNYSIVALDIGLIIIFFVKNAWLSEGIYEILSGQITLLTLRLLMSYIYIWSTYS